MKCKYCSSKVTDVNSGYLEVLDDIESSRFKELKLNKNEHICIDCKKMLLFSSIISIL